MAINGSFSGVAGSSNQGEVPKPESPKASAPAAQVKEASGRRGFQVQRTNGSEVASQAALQDIGLW